jgi:hypothetical protein
VNKENTMKNEVYETMNTTDGISVCVPISRADAARTIWADRNKVEVVNYPGERRYRFADGRRVSVLTEGGAM